MLAVVGILFCVQACDTDLGLMSDKSSLSVEPTAPQSVPTSTTPPPTPPPIVNGMFSFATWNDVFTAMDRLEASQQDWETLPPPLEPARSSTSGNGVYTSASADPGTGPTPYQSYVANLGMSSLYNKYAYIEAGTMAPPAGVDTFAIQLFSNDAVRAVLNTNFEVRVAGQAYNALQTALNVSSMAGVNSAIQASYTYCTRVSVRRRRSFVPNTGDMRRFNALNSFYPLGPVQMLTVNYKNEELSGGNWRGTKANLQVGVEGRLRVPVICENFLANGVQRLSRIRENQRSMQLRRVLIPDIWKAPGDFTTVLNVTGVPYASSVSYQW